MEVRRELARVSTLERPWQLLANRQAQAAAVRAGALLAGVQVDLPIALAVVDGRSPGLVAGADLARAWHDTLGLLDALADPARPAWIDDGLVRALHWLLHRHRPETRPGQLRDAAVLRLAPPPAEADPIDTAVWTAAALDRADPCWSGSGVVAHAVELLLLAQADGLAPWYAGRSSRVGDPREVLQATAAAHLQRCREAEQRWFAVGRLLAEAALPDRLAGPCWDAASGVPLTNSSYRSAAAVVRRRPVREQQASRDLRALVEVGLLHARGRTSDRAYRWSG